MVKRACELIIVLLVVRFLIIGSFADVAALLIAFTAYFTHSFLNRKTDVSVEELKAQCIELQVKTKDLEDKVGQMSLAQGFKKLGGKS